MKVLLDTHALLWWFTDDARLSTRARELIGGDNEVLVSAASAWEIATKVRLGKLEHAGDVVRRFDELLAADGFSDLPITRAHALQAGSYPQPHRDPFDRMLAAQSELEGVPLLSCDPALAAFGASPLW